MSSRRAELRGAARGKAKELETWRGTYADLTRLVREAFAFLEKKEGMRFSRNLLPPECHLVFSHPAKRLVVSVSSEYDCAPWMVVFVDGRNHRMDRLIKLLAPERVALEPRVDARQPTEAGVRALLGYYAKFLRECGRPIFDLDVAALASLKPKRARR